MPPTVAANTSEATQDIVIAPSYQRKLDTLKLETQCEMIGNNQKNKLANYFVLNLGNFVTLSQTNVWNLKVQPDKMQLQSAAADLIKH